MIMIAVTVAIVVVIIRDIIIVMFTVITVTAVILWGVYSGPYYNPYLGSMSFGPARYVHHNSCADLSSGNSLTWPHSVKVSECTSHWFGVGALGI